MTNVSVKGLSFTADHQDHVMLLRKYVSRIAADKGWALLELVGLEYEVIKTCFYNHPMDVEEAVQSGLIRWKEGQGIAPPTWKVLLKAMADADFAILRIIQLKEVIGYTEGMLSAYAEVFGTVGVVAFCIYMWWLVVYIMCMCCVW